VSAVNGWVIIDYMRSQFDPVTPSLVAGFALFIASYYLLVIYFAVSCRGWGRGEVSGRYTACPQYRKGWTDR
jgi:hypothetical protein